MQPKIYTFEEHQIPPDKIDQHAFYVIEKLKQAGHQAYLVGGGVRDLLLKGRPKDFDLSTSAKPEEIRALFRNAILIGRRFRLAHIRFGKKIIEVSTFRAGDTESTDLIVRDNVWGTEEQDVLRRDFTINGLFYDPQNQTVIDYVGGFPDIEKRVLRAIGQPEARFIQDPVRMIRLLKFAARLNFDIDKPTHEALLRCKEHIIKSSSARLLEELLRMLESGSSEPFFRLLHQYGLLKYLLSPLSWFIDLDRDGRVHKFLSELDSQMKKSWPNTPDRSLSLAALCFPILDLEADRLLHRLFSPFFSIPRKLKGMAVFVLSSQYRFSPLDNKPIRRPRIPRDETFPLALELFRIRTTLEPELLPLYTTWTEAAFASHQAAPVGASDDETAPRRNRRRRRKTTRDDPS